MSFLGAKGTPIPTANTIEEGMVGAPAPNWEPEELLPKEEREKIKKASAPKAKAKKAGPKHTKTSLMKNTKNQLEALGRKEFNIELDKRKTKATLVKELLGTIKKAG